MKLAGTFFTLGLILAMSDGPWFPYINFSGVVIFSLFPVAAWRAQRIKQKRIIHEAIGRR